METRTMECGHCLNVLDTVNASSSFSCFVSCLLFSYCILDVVDRTGRDPKAGSLIVFDSF